MAKAIMIQGTMSNAGKSFLVAGLCRIFKQDGYRVAPFKSQNMALNSYITTEGLEMGRAQVMQAEACGIRPSVRMNPILLKPTGDMRSQVIVNGEIRGHMDAVEYYRRKRELIPDIQRAYRALEEEYDIITIEGAGSPAEINLKAGDIVNMGMAKMAGAPVLLAGDIDRGGVFAQLLGTMLLLEKDERALVKGLLINKFRGDIKILEPGLAMLEERCRRPVFGVIPYMQVDIEDEDSLSERLSSGKKTKEIEIAVIRLPRISNFTDFNPLEIMEGVSVRYVQTPKELGSCDMIILPGTKSTIEDLKWLRQSGLEPLLLRAAKQGVLLFGICGGYQMMGERILDPEGIEGDNSIRGMGLLPMETIFAREKTRTRVQGKIKTLASPFEPLSGVWVEGYEIHMGLTRRTESGKNKEKYRDFIGIESLEEGLTDGICIDNIAGTYLHGIFESDALRMALAALLYHRRGMDAKEASVLSYQDYKERQYDKMAQKLREHLDMDRIYEIIEKGV